MLARTRLFWHAAPRFVGTADLADPTVEVAGASRRHVRRRQYDIRGSRDTAGRHESWGLVTRFAKGLDVSVEGTKVVLRNGAKVVPRHRGERLQREHVGDNPSSESEAAVIRRFIA
jgi:hypothetical protein